MDMPTIEYKCRGCGKWIKRGTFKWNAIAQPGRVWCSGCQGYTNECDTEGRTKPEDPHVVTLTADVMFTDRKIVEEMAKSQLEKDIATIADGHRSACATRVEGMNCDCGFYEACTRLVEHSTMIRAAMDAAAKKAHEIAMAISSRDLQSQIDDMREGAAKQNFLKTIQANARDDGQIAALAADVFELLVMELIRMGVPDTAVKEHCT